MNRKQRRGTGTPSAGQDLSAISALFAQAVQQHQAGRLDQAERLYRQILSRDPRHADSLHLLGVLARKAGHNGAAAELMTQAIAVRPLFPEAFSNLGNAFLSLGRHGDALACFRQAIAQKPSFAEGHFNLANTLRLEGRLDEAAASYKTCLALKPEMAEAHYLLGLTCQLMRRPTEAAGCYEKAIALRPDHADAHNNLGVVLKDLGRVEAAITCYQTAALHMPDHSEAHNNLGNALALLGRLDESLASYQRAIAIKPDYAEAHYNLGNALKALGRDEDAVASYRRAYSARTGASPEGREDEQTGATTLFLELTNKCNFHCQFCPSDQQTRPAGYMELGLAKNILDEAAARKLVQKVDFHIMGEPFLHPDIFDILAHAALRRLKIELVTNGSTLTDKIVHRLLDTLRGKLIVSLQTPTRESFSLRGKVGLGWERYLDGIRLLAREHMKRIQSGGCEAEIEIRVMVTKDTGLCVDIVESSEEIRSILKEWRDFTALAEAELGLPPIEGAAKEEDTPTLLANGGAFTQYTLQRGLHLTFWRAFTFANTCAKDDVELHAKDEASYCPHPFEDAGILWNGDVTLCCLDYDGQLTVGNVRTGSLEEALASEEARRLRASMLGRTPRRQFCIDCQARPGQTS
jgi:tetratricopeptide (TPR) repeat protein